MTLVALSGWAKSTATRTVYPCLYLYDADYSFIGHLIGYGRGMDNTYINVVTQIPIPAGVGYVRAGYYISGSAAGEIFYLDGYIFSPIEAKGCISGLDTFIEAYGVTASGNTRTDKKDMQMYKTFEVDLIVTSLGGTNPTLDVTVHEVRQDYGTVIVGVFTQATGVTQERITLTHCTGRQLHIEYVLGGTNPEFDFQASVAGKGL